MKKTVSIPFMMAGILFVVCFILSNLLATKVIRIGSISGTAALLVFPIAYIINDCIVEIWGYSKARLIIWTGFLMNFFVVGLTQIAIVMPPAPFWEGDEAFKFIFGLGPRIVAASFCAFLVGSFLNAYVMSRMKVASGGKHFSLRAIVSTLVGESADSVIFFPIAFGALIGWNELWLLALTQALLKSLYEVIILPVTIQVVKWVKRLDQSDVYDKEVSFNPFRVKEM
ncbi:MAG: queuosine precursor transporter [Tannerella sp.]|nr:queuosine precursor transporter [Tannerella sp.]